MKSWRTFKEYFIQICTAAYLTKSLSFFLFFCLSDSGEKSQVKPVWKTREEWNTTTTTNNDNDNNREMHYHRYYS